MTIAAGTRLGRYEIRSKIGEGGMGEVYLAQDTRLRRPVALKLLPANLTRDEARLRRFEQEACAASALNHPNIITVHDVDADDGTHFIATEYVEGETLRRRMGRGPLSLREALDVAVQAAAALSAAHAAGIVHRDIKPENVMVRADGYVKILDFGLAKLTEAHAPDPADLEAATRALVNTDPGTVMGTVSYMSPEQARGWKGREPDGRTDVWSLGCVLYEMLAGRTPFEGETASDVISLILQKEPPKLSLFSEEVTGEVELIVEKALAKDPEERYQTAKDFLNDLKRVRRHLDASAEIERTVPPGLRAAAGTGASLTRSSVGTVRRSAAETSPAESARPTSSAEYLVGGIKRHRLGVLIALALVVLALAGGYAVYRLTSKPGRRAVSFEGAKLSRLTTSGRVTRAVISPDGKYVVHVVDDAGQQSLRLRQVATGSDKEIVAPAPVLYQSLAFTPDGNYVYYHLASRDLPRGALYQVPTLGGEPKRLLVNLGSSPVSFSPDGKRFAFIRNEAGQESALMIANADGGGEQKLVTRSPPETCALPAWSPDGRTIAYVARSSESNDATVVVAQVADGSVKPLASQRWFRVQRLAWLADGSGLLMLANDQQRISFQIWHLSYPEGEARRVTNDLNNYADLSLTADSRTLAAVQSEPQANLWVAPEGDAARARQVTSGAGKIDGSSGVSWAPDGRIVYDVTSGGGEDIWIADADGRNQKQLTANARLNGYPVVSPDGHVFFMSDRTGLPHIWRMGLDGGNQRQLTDGPGEHMPDCSPDGRWVVYQTVYGRATIWRVPAEGGEPVQLTDKGSLRPAVSPDGKWIAYFHVEENAPLRIAVIPSEGGQPVKTFDVPPTLTATAWPGWTPDGRGVIYVDTREGVSNLWAQPLDGGEPKRLTDFKSDRIFRFAFSRDGKQLALSRGTVNSDVVLVSEFFK